MILTSSGLKIKALFMGRTDLPTGKWFPIAKLSWQNNCSEYKLEYVNGAKSLQRLYPEQSNLITFGSLERVRRFPDLKRSPWSNRIPTDGSIDKRTWEFLALDSYAPIEYAALSGGYRHGDTCDLFPEVIAFGLTYRFIFRNIGSFAIATPNRVELNSICAGERVKLVDSSLLVEDRFIGNAPPYIRYLQQEYRDNLQISVLKVNRQAPFEHQFLCQAIVSNPHTPPFTHHEFLPVTS